MTRNQLPTDDLNHFPCHCAAISSCQLEKSHDTSTKEFPEDQTNVERSIGSNEGLITEARLPVTKTEMDNHQNGTATAEDLIPVKTEQKQNEHHKANGDFEYVSLNLHIWKRTKSDGARYKTEKHKPNCYYGKTQDTVNKKPARSKSADACRGPVQNSAGIAESPVFFSAIGEWTIIDLNLRAFEREEANRIRYLRRKCTPYKEVEPESNCRIL